MSVFLEIILGNWEWFAGSAVAVFGAVMAHKSGANKVRADHAKDKDKREAAGRDAVKRGRNSGLSPADRLRRNDGDWGGL